MIPLPTVLSTIGCLGALAMLPHVILPVKMCKLFLEEKFPESETTQSQLTLFHFALFTQLFFLAISIVIAGQTCPCLPVAFFFVFIIATRLVHVFMGFKNELIGLAKKPVMLQVCIALLDVTLDVLAVRGLCCSCTAHSRAQLTPSHLCLVHRSSSAVF